MLVNDIVDKPNGYSEGKIEREILMTVRKLGYLFIGVFASRNRHKITISLQIHWNPMEINRNIPSFFYSEVNGKTDTTKKATKSKLRQ